VAIGHAASAGDLQKAQAKAESEGYLLELSHDVIVTKAKKERGRLRGHISQDPSTFNAVAAAFKSEYPFVDPHIEEFTGSEAGVSENEQTCQAKKTNFQWPPEGKQSKHVFDLAVGLRRCPRKKSALPIRVGETKRGDDLLD
jgi:hypothetical protein